MSDRPNLLFIMCDELRWCDVGCYGDAAARTPHMDRLAREGVRIEHAISNAPVCMPARSVVLSGQHARTCTGTANNTALRFTRDADGEKGWCFDYYAPPKKAALPEATLPELLRGAGYHTRAVGKWHVDAWPHEVGFDDYRIPRNHHAHTAQPFTHNGGPEYCPAGFSVEHEADAVCDFLANPGERPWFLYYNISPPHMPLADMPQKYLEMFDPADVARRGNVPAGFEPTPEQRSTYLWDFRQYLAHLPSAAAEGAAATLETLIALYRGATAWVDDTLGRVLAALEKSGAAENTLVVFTSDHGDMLGSHGLMGKANLYEESIRVPMLVRGPGLPRGRVADDGVGSLLDVAPTLLAVAGLDVPDHMHGVDLLPALRGDAALPEHAIIETGGDGVGIRTPDTLLGLRRGDDGRLADRPHKHYDLLSDPLQLQPLDADANALCEQLQAWDAATPWLDRAAPA